VRILPVISDPLLHSPLFDRYIAVDWSANNSPKFGRNSIWAAVGDAAADTIETVNIGTRRQVERWLLQQLGAAVQRRERALVGLDFPYGYPVGFASMLGLTDQSWRGVWSYLASSVRDDERNRSNRFGVAAAINQRLGCDAPFWGRPASQPTEHLPTTKEVTYRGRQAGGLSEWRAVEDRLHVAGKHPQSVWKLAYAGSVGSQALLGIPVVHRLRRDPQLRDVSVVWPFEVAVPVEPPGNPLIVHAEIWPSAAPFSHESGTCPDGQQVRAVVRYWRHLDRSGQLRLLFESAPDAETVRQEEGWILGVTELTIDGTAATPPSPSPARIQAKSRSATPGRKSSGPTRSCECGCGVEGPGRFRPGHDAKLRSRLMKALQAGDEEARQRLAELGWR
jgi:precorrin-8X/cobalt-precorrin-8 methylmutase